MNTQVHCFAVFAQVTNLKVQMKRSFSAWVHAELSLKFKYRIAANVHWLPMPSNFRKRNVNCNGNAKILLLPVLTEFGRFHTILAHIQLTSISRVILASWITGSLFMDQFVSVAERLREIGAIHQPGMSLQTAEASFLTSREAQSSWHGTQCWHTALVLHNKFSSRE